MLDKQRATESLVRRGLRMTRQRQAVLDAIGRADGSFTAQQLHDAVRAESVSLGLTTVYRTLDILADVGAVERVHGPSNCEAFVAAGRTHGHTVVCRVCGAAAELSGLDCSGLLAEAAQKTGFRIDEHVVQLSGVCARCSGEAVGGGSGEVPGSAVDGVHLR